jgi:hypothetical protein
MPGTNVDFFTYINVNTQINPCQNFPFEASVTNNSVDDYLPYYQFTHYFVFQLPTMNSYFVLASFCILALQCGCFAEEEGKFLVLCHIQTNSDRLGKGYSKEK